MVTWQLRRHLLDAAKRLRDYCYNHLSHLEPRNQQLTADPSRSAGMTHLLMNASVAMLELLDMGHRKAHIKLHQASICGGGMAIISAFIAIQIELK